MTDPKVVEVFRFVQDLMWGKHIAPRPDERDANNQAGGFAGGIVSMMPGGTWNITGYQQMKDGWGMAPLPLYQNASVMPYWLGGWVIPKQSAALSAAHLAAILFPDTLRRLYIVRDNDPAGDGARDSLVARAHEVGIEAITLSPMLGDFNEDLATYGLDAVRAEIRVQIAPEDVSRFMASSA